MNIYDCTPAQRLILRELIDSMNTRRRRRRLRPVGPAALPSLPGAPERYYLVDTYRVRRHWRRRPGLVTSVP